MQTVAGPVSPGALGFTLMHEHLFSDFLAGFAWPEKASRTDPAVFRRMEQIGWTIPRTEEELEFFNRRRLTLDMVNQIRRGWRSRSNLQIEDEREVAEEVRVFRDVGGRTIVDVTPAGMDRDARRLRDFSARNGITVIAGTAWYRWPFHSLQVKNATGDELTAQFVNDVVVGMDGSNIRAGIIGEIPIDTRSMHVATEDAGKASNETITARVRAAEERLTRLPVDERARVALDEIYDAAELKVLRAAARASRLTGASLTLHARDPWLGYLPMILAEGVPASRIIIGHAHPHFMDRALLARAMKAGVNLEADYWLQYYASASPLGPIEEILDGVAWAIKNGHRDQVLLSLDLCYKLGQQRYGGGGYATLHDYVFPKLRKRGVSDADIRYVMVENPKRLLTIAAPQRVVRLQPRPADHAPD